jgi:hypothetical protein
MGRDRLGMFYVMIEDKADAPDAHPPGVRPEMAQG